MPTVILPFVIQPNAILLKVTTLLSVFIPTVILPFDIQPNAILLKVTNECHYAYCHFGECRSA